MFEVFFEIEFVDWAALFVLAKAAFELFFAIREEIPFEATPEEGWEGGEESEISEVWEAEDEMKALEFEDVVIALRWIETRVWK